jgi:FKBP-type peptidyl-prolyl cis-trans isomerase
LRVVRGYAPRADYVGTIAEELDCFLKGMTDVFMGKVDQEAVSKELAEKVSKILLERKQEREAPMIAETKAKAVAVEKKLLEAAGQKDGAVKLPSGVVVVHTKVGPAETPGRCAVHVR